MIQRILLIRTDRMGDLLMTLPAVHGIRKGLPGAEITLLAQEGLEPLLEDHPDVDRTLTWNPAEGKGWKAILRSAARLRSGRFDAAVVFNPTREFHLACFLAGIPIRVGYKRKMGMLLTASIPDTKGQRKRHEADYNLELAELLGIKTGEPVLRLPEREKTARQAQDLLQSHGLLQGGGPIALHPWTSNPAKSWPLDSFWRLSAQLQQLGRPVVVIGGTEALPEMESALSTAPPSLRNLVGKIPLGLLPAFIRRCALLVSNDSGPTHVAAAVGTPLVVVAPRSHADLLERWKPLGKRCLVLIDPDVAAAAEAARRQLNDVQVGIPPV